MSQAPFLAELRLLGAPAVHPFSAINAIAATVSPAEAARLAASPLVTAVAPDRLIRLRPARMPSEALDGPGALPTIRARADKGALSAASDPAPACAAGRTPSLEPEALQLTNTAALDTATPRRSG